MIDALKRLPNAAQENLRETDLPQWAAPMLATLANERFSDKDWLYERMDVRIRQPNLLSHVCQRQQ